MKKIILATASALVLGLAGSGFSLAADSSNYSTTAPGSTMSQSSNNEAAPASESQIKQVQEQLKANGLYKGEVDGKMGPETKQAISQFQQQNGLQQSGSLDQQTLSALSNNQNTSGSGTGANPGRSSSGSGSLNNSNSNSSSAGTGTGSNSILGTGGSSMGGSTAGSAGSATGGSTGSATGGSSGR